MWTKERTWWVCEPRPSCPTAKQQIEERKLKPSAPERRTGSHEAKLWYFISVTISFIKEKIHQIPRGAALLCPPHARQQWRLRLCGPMRPLKRHPSAKFGNTRLRPRPAWPVRLTHPLVPRSGASISRGVEGADTRRPKKANLASGNGISWGFNVL